jgi:hypothetical protein
MKLEKIPNKKNLKKLKSVELTHQTHNMRHEIEMTTWKVNHNKS